MLPNDEDDGEDVDCLDNTLLRTGEDVGSLTEEGWGGRELSREVLLLLLLLMLLGVVKDIEELKPEYGDDDKLVIFRFMADDILLPIELMFRMFSSMESSIVLTEFFADKLSILSDEDAGELQSIFIAELSAFVCETLEKDVFLLPLARRCSPKSFSFSPFLRVSLITDVFLFADVEDDRVFMEDVANALLKSEVVLLLSYL